MRFNKMIQLNLKSCQPELAEGGLPRKEVSSLLQTGFDKLSLTTLEQLNLSK